MKLVEIAPPEFDVVLDIAYATPDNFTGSPIYARPGCYLHEDAAELLHRAIGLAAAHDMKIRIFDAFRPVEAQQIMWKHTPDPEFLTDPATGSPHSRGVAVDLTLEDAEGCLLDMGTGFDAFTPLSHHGSLEICRQAQANRHFLLGLMSAAGWDFYRNEWWHYQLFASRSYDLFGDDELSVPMMRQVRPERIRSSAE